VLAPDALVHPRATALVGARVGVQIKAADRLAGDAGDVEEAHVRVPHRCTGALADAHTEQPLGDLEQPGQHRGSGKYGRNCSWDTEKRSRCSRSA